MSKEIVYVDMVGDLFHYGHVNMLRNAKNQGDILYVGVHNDLDVKSYKRTPIMTMEERIKVIEDAAESIGATYKNKQAGTFGDVGCYSFEEKKINDYW